MYLTNKNATLAILFAVSTFAAVSVSENAANAASDGSVSVSTASDSIKRSSGREDVDGGKMKPDRETKKVEAHKAVKLNFGRGEKIDVETRQKRRALKLKRMRNVEKDT